MKKIRIEPIHESAIVQTGTRLLTALLDKNLSIRMSCGGKGICSTCHVRITEGMDQLSPMREREKRTLRLVADSGPTSRLACQACVFGDSVRVEVPAGMYIEKADDLLALVGSRAPENILHPIRGHVLIPKDKMITRTMLELSRNIEKEVENLKNYDTDSHQSGSDNLRSGSTIRGSTASSELVRPPVIATVKPPSIPGIDRSSYLDTPTNNPKKTSGFPGENPAPAVSDRGNVPVPSRIANKIAIEPGATIDKYLLIEPIGRGGAGVVFRALHTKLNCLVAIKFLRNRNTNSDKLIQRFCAEARLLAQMNHPHIVRVLDFEDSPELPYVVMEFVDGVSAAELIRQCGRVQVEQAVDIALNVSAGLSAVRKLGIIHRDIKPANILIDRAGKARLVDFGLARRTSEDVGSAGPESRHGDIPEGTPAYMSPEQIQMNQELDHRTDIYSLGVTLFHLVCGQLPFSGANPLELIAKHLTASVPLAHEVTPTVPRELSEIICRMMSKNPRNRYPDYETLANDLQAIRKPAAIEVG